MSSKYIDGVNEENMDEFLAALRSGEFVQGSRRLCSVDERGVSRYCCLGVGSELMARKGLVDRDSTEYSSKYNGNRFLAPGELMDWLGIPEENACDEFGNEYDVIFFKAPSHLNVRSEEYASAADMNDVNQASFTEIADVFENEFKRED